MLFALLLACSSSEEGAVLKVFPLTASWSLADLEPPPEGYLVLDLEYRLTNSGSNAIMVEVLDTWESPAPMERYNVPDDVSVHGEAGSYELEPEASLDLVAKVVFSWVYRPPLVGQYDDGVTHGVEVCTRSGCEAGAMVSAPIDVTLTE